MEKEDHRHRELQLLPLPPPPPLSARLLPPPPMEASTSRRHCPPSDVDLQLSISLQPAEQRPAPPGRAEALRWQAAEQVRMAAVEKAYAERVRELTRREMELAQAELARARLMWQRARDDVARAEMLKEKAIVKVGSSSATTSCMEITCHSCRQRFRP